jgi:aspartyl protease family protein
MPRMASDSLAQLLYLALLGSVIAAYFLIQNRRNLGRVAQMAAIWGLIFVGVIFAVALWGDLRHHFVKGTFVITEPGQVMIPQSPDGHYYVLVGVNGEPVEFMIDTGASDIVLTQRDARRIGIDLADMRFHGRAETANGTVQTAFVRIDEMSMGPFVDRSIRASVTDGELPWSLMGMAYLRLYDRIEIVGNRMYLSRDIELPRG